MSPECKKKKNKKTTQLKNGFFFIKEVVWTVSKHIKSLNIISYQGNANYNHYVGG